MTYLHVACGTSPGYRMASHAALKSLYIGHMANAKLGSIEGRSEDV